MTTIKHKDSLPQDMPAWASGPLWHVCRDGGYLTYDMRGVKVGPGMMVKVHKPIRLGVYGLHATNNISTAFSYATGNMLCQVRLSGKKQNVGNLVCAKERTVEWMFDATQLLAIYVKQVLIVYVPMMVEKWDKYPEVLMKYLEGVVYDVLTQPLHFANYPISRIDDVAMAYQEKAMMSNRKRDIMQAFHAWALGDALTGVLRWHNTGSPLFMMGRLNRLLDCVRRELGEGKGQVPFMVDELEKMATVYKQMLEEAANE